MQQPAGHFDLVAESDPVWQRVETKCVVCRYHFLVDRFCHDRCSRSSIRQFSRNTLPWLSRTWRKSQSEEIFIERKFRIIKGIALQAVVPFRLYVIKVRQKSHFLRCALAEATADRLVVDQLGMWGPYNPIPSLSQPQAKIGVMKVTARFSSNPPICM